MDTQIIHNHPALEAKLRVRPIRERKVYRLGGVGGPEFIVHNHSVRNASRAILGRVLFREVDGQLVPAPQPAAGAWDRDMASFKAMLGGIEAVPCSAGDFVGMYAGDRRHATYKAAMESLEAVPLSTWDAVIKAFVKAEKVRVTSAKPDPCPRLIQPRSARYNLEVGRYLKALEHVIYHRIEAQTRSTPVRVHVAKGRNAGQTGALFAEIWGRYACPVALSADATRFDQHVSQAALRWEHQVYLACFRGHHRSHLRWLLGMQLANAGRVYCPDGKLRYKTKGSRMSGDMNTALGNVLLMCAMCWTWARGCGVPCDIVDNGDDVVFICDRDHVERLRNGLCEQFRRWGFTMELEDVVGDLEKVSFCQTQPVLLSQGYVMVRDPRICMAKDLVSVQPLNQGFRGYLTAVGTCGHAMYADCPVLGPFYRRCVEEGKGQVWRAGPLSETGFARLARGMVAREVMPSIDTRVSFWKAFGVLPSDQEEVEREIERLSWVDGVAQMRDSSTPSYSDVNLLTS